jgi:hypothetical protein
MKSLIGVFLALIMCCALAVTVTTKVILPMADDAMNNYMDANGVTAIAEGTVSNKQYIAAHTDNERTFLFSSSSFYPEKYEIQIRRYDTAKNKWETAAYDIDKATFDKLNVGDHYKDSLNRTTYFWFDNK